MGTSGRAQDEQRHRCQVRLTTTWPVEGDDAIVSVPEDTARHSNEAAGLDEHRPSGAVEVELHVFAILGIRPWPGECAAPRHMVDGGRSRSTLLRLAMSRPSPGYGIQLTAGSYDFALLSPNFRPALNNLTCRRREQCVSCNTTSSSSTTPYTTYCRGFSTYASR